MPIYERKDRFYQQAKAEGYRSRAAYKLLELDRRHRLLARGARVLDLGCAPGGWIQVAAAKVGPGGRVVGIDRLAVDPLGLAQACVLRGDLADADSLARLESELGGPADVVLSDMAPDTSGVGFQDHVRSVELVRLALGVARRLLRPGGAMLAKVFEGPDLQALAAELKAAFGRLKRIKPEATRKGSRELYLLCEDHRAPAATAGRHEERA
ncbi:MAG TPA: RlmE family RNA methyltransferase [Myxococcota bacterium]|nr:RlmE family RNA methyltransferase [Myxococcota bacterium]HRY96690.1 RlmE family RNA methyltransferase [Myxococcota bacterium]HSA20222.1 RlmE family RNA methyltransferase [Myxococcota bacterium]